MTLAKLEWKLFVDARILSLKNRLRKVTIGIGIGNVANGKCSAQLNQNTMIHAIFTAKPIHKQGPKIKSLIRKPIKK